MDVRARNERSLHLVPPPHEPDLAPAARNAAPHTRRDERVERAIARMRSDLAQRWTVTKLARSVGLSRPVFARRFVESTGMSPLRYLTRLRMEQAAQRVVQSDAGLAEIGVHVGYESEFAFNRAFKRFHGIAPGVFRRSARATTAPVFRAAA